MNPDVGITSFEQRIVAELCASDGLAVIASGLAVTRVLHTLCGMYATDRHLVFVLNLSDRDEQRINEVLAVDSGQQVMVLNSNYTSAERGKLYRQGGCFSVSKSILITDLLSEVAEPRAITGFVVADAHRITDTSTEHFILRVYRQGNRVGFIKALSDQPHAFLTGYGKLDTVLKCLFVTKLFLWPRY
jgi:DNA excision repair protein ERCC-4